MGGIARARVLVAPLIIFACMWGALSVAGAAPARPSGALRAVRYRGLSVRVPRSWPVFNLARDPQTCLRFDRHALYLGTPGREERCPAHAVGRTEAILISPLHGRRGAPGSTASALALEGDATSFSVGSAGVEVTATWSRDPQVVSRALGRRSLPQAQQSPASAAGRAATRAQPAGSSGRRRFFTGVGFDTCAAPSASQMSAWFHSSRDRGVGIYIGGVNEACAQPNLNRRWIHHEVASGWHPAPLWVGPQAPTPPCSGCVGMSSNPSQAHSQGGHQANAAAAQAKRLGILRGNPIYYDLEGFSAGPTNTRAVLAFLSAWTTRLHADGYISGVYGSAFSTQHVLISRHGTRYHEPNDIWIADWNGERTARDPHVPDADWSHHQRLHQYRGNVTETHGGVTLNVDDDFFNGATANDRKTKARNGYLLLTSNGGVHRFGPVARYGSDAGKLSHGVTAVALAEDSRTGGYWILSSNGAVKGFHAPVHGSLRGRLHGHRPVALAGSPRGGYLVLSSNGAVHRFGPIDRYGSDAGRLSHGVTAVALARDPTTGGYWILRSDGRVDAFHAPSHGGLKNRLGGRHATTGIAAAQRGGYLILTSNGAVHAFGHAKLFGSDAGKLPAGVTAVSLATSPATRGYRILRSNGGVNSFGAPSYGSLAGKLPTGSSALTIADASG